jgi:hypothetical protein
MKLFKFVKSSALAVLCAAALAVPRPAAAQIPGGDKVPGNMSTALLLKLFGANTNFISRVDVRVLDKNHRESTTMSMGFDMLAGKIRMDVNATDVKINEMPDFLLTMKKNGMDQISCILNPEKKTVISICPVLKSYMELPMDKDEIDAFALDYQLEKTADGKESISGHSCDKTEINVTDSKGAKQHVIIWTAADMKGLPLQFQTSEDDSTTIMRLKDVKLGRPDNTLFEAPPEMKRYDNISAFMTEAIGKNMPAAAK